MKNALAAIALLLLAACAPAAPSIDRAAELSAIDAVEAAQLAAFNAKDIDGAVAPYTSDAVFALTGAPSATGPDAIRALFQGMISDPNLALSLTRQGSAVAASGDLAYTTSVYSVTMTDPTTHQPAATSGTAVTVWKKQAGGSWQIAADYNIDQPAQ
jgi:uncharacterized protein (TIGR02246 family)